MPYTIHVHVQGLWHLHFSSSASIKISSWRRCSRLNDCHCLRSFVKSIVPLSASPSDGMSSLISSIQRSLRLALFRFPSNLLCSALGVRIGQVGFFRYFASQYTTIRYTLVPCPISPHLTHATRPNIAISPILHQRSSTRVHGLFYCLSCISFLLLYSSSSLSTDVLFIIKSNILGLHIHTCGPRTTGGYLPGCSKIYLLTWNQIISDFKLKYANSQNLAIFHFFIPITGKQPDGKMK